MKKLFNVLKTIFVWLVVAFATFMMIFTIVSVTMFDQYDRNIFGYKFYVVQSDSMAATDFDAGDIAISKEVSPYSLGVGDIITFISQNPESIGQTITHKIREIKTDERGNRGFVTYGTTTDTNDTALVTEAYILGQYQGRIPKVGSFFMFLKTTPGYIVCILVPFLILIISQGVNSIRLFRRYKADQMEEMRVEREAIEKEKAESQRMIAELMELKQQLANGGVPVSQQPQPVYQQAADPATATNAAPQTVATQSGELQAISVPQPAPQQPTQQPYVQGGQAYIPVGQPFVQGGQTYIPVAQPYVQGGQTYIPVGQPYVQGGQAYIPVAQPYVQGGQAYVPVAQPYVQGVPQPAPNGEAQAAPDAVPVESIAVPGTILQTSDAPLATPEKNDEASAVDLGVIGESKPKK